MSKNSAKQNLEALTEWMSVRRVKRVNKAPQSRFEAYKQRGMDLLS